MGTTSPPVGPEPWYQKKWVWVTAAVFGAIAIIGSFSDGDDAEPAAQKSPAEQPAAVVTVTESPEPEPSEEPVDEPTEQAAAVEQPAGESQVGNDPVSNGVTFTVPSETGKTLQAAQDDLQAVTGNPFYFTDSEDATGAGRFQAIDSGWQVCSQTPKPGTKLSVDDMSIVFHVVRVSESCP